jgi:hypothetical protein
MFTLNCVALHIYSSYTTSSGRIYCRPLDGHLSTRTMPLAFLSGKHTDGVRHAVHRQSPYNVRPWPYNGRCAALIE